MTLFFNKKTNIKKQTKPIPSFLYIIFFSKKTKKKKEKAINQNQLLKTRKQKQ